MDDFFHQGPRPSHKKPRTLCPACVEELKRRSDPFWGYVFLLIALLGLAVSLLDRRTTLGPLLVNVALLELLVFICTILHELGHVTGGRITGLGVFATNIGHGRTVADFRLGGLRWIFRATPFGGAVYTAPRRTTLYRVRQIICVVAGPFVNGILLLLSIIGFAWDNDLSGGITDGLAPAKMLFFANATLLIYSLWPFEISTSYGKKPNDALLLWRIWKLRQPQITQLPLLWYAYEADAQRRRRKYGRALEWIEAGLKLFPDDFHLKSQRAVILLDRGEYRAALRENEELLARNDPNSGIEHLLLNNVAYASILTADPNLLQRADDASRKALDQVPWVPYYKDTRGAVLVKLGQYNEGLKLLADAFRSHNELSDRAACACWIAESLFDLHDHAQADRYVMLAKRLDRYCPLLDWVERRELENIQEKR